MNKIILAYFLILPSMAIADNGNVILNPLFFQVMGPVGAIIPFLAFLVWIVWTKLDEANKALEKLHMLNELSSIESDLSNISEKMDDISTMLNKFAELQNLDERLDGHRFSKFVSGKD
ncbi:MAG: hypothetical protein WCA64_06130 [Gallionella sp.]